MLVPMLSIEYKSFGFKSDEWIGLPLDSWYGLLFTDIAYQ